MCFTARARRNLKNYDDDDILVSRIIVVNFNITLCCGGGCGVAATLNTTSAPSHAMGTIATSSRYSLNLKST